MIYSGLKRGIWFALLAVWVAVLAPTISRALAASTGTAWIEVCTAQGLKWIAVADGLGDSTPGKSPGSHLDHCPFCTRGVPDTAAPPSHTGTLGLLTLSAEPPTQRVQHEAPLLDYGNCAQARAPPVFS